MMLECADDPYDAGAGPEHGPVVPVGVVAVPALETSPAVQHVVLPLNDVVVTDFVDGVTVVTNVLTHESSRINGEWELLFGDEYLDAVLYQVNGDDDAGVRDLDDVLRRTVVRRDEALSPQDELFERTFDGRTMVLHSLDLQMVRHRPATLVLKVGACASRHSFDIAVFKRARASGLRCFFALADLYQCMDADTFGTQGKWVQRGVPRWDKWITEHLGPCHFVYSSFESEQTSKRLAMPFRSRCIATTSTSTAGFLLLLLRFSCASRAQGGLASGNSRAACRLVLAALLAQAYIGMQTIATVELDQWACTFPRPPPIPTGSTAKLSIIGDQIDIDPLSVLYNDPSNASTVAKKKLKLIFNEIELGTKMIALIDFLDVCTKEPKLMQLTAQLCLMIAKRLEGVFAHMGFFFFAGL